MAIYRYILSSRLGNKIVNPSNSKAFKKTWVIESNKSEIIEKFPGPFLFGGDDFAWLNILEKSQFRCEYVSIIVQKKCNSKYNTIFEGKFSLNSGKFDELRCTVQLEIEDNEKYKCWENNKNKELDAFILVLQRKSTYPYRGIVETIVKEIISDLPNPPENVLFPGLPNPGVKGWVKVLGNSYLEESGLFTVRTTFGRIVYNEGGIPDGWEFDSDIGKYVIKPITFNKAFDTQPGFAASYFSTIFEGAIDNGIDFKLLLQAVVSAVCPGLTVVSDFFQINPLNITDINYVTGQKSKVNNLIVFQKSDVKRASTSQNATIFKLTADRFINDLCNTFQLEWKITEENNFVIEHVKRKNRFNGLDTTLSDLNKGKKKYSYDRDKIPLKENFNFMETSSGDFAGLPIEYSGACTSSTKIDNISVEKITTDVAFCIENYARDSKVSDEGMVLVAVNSLNMILIEEKILPNSEIINNSLAWAQLHNDYWRYNRSLKKFLMNGLETTAVSVKPTKIQEDLKVKINCGEVFNPDGFIKSLLGDNGILNSASYDLSQELLTLSVAFPAEDGIITNENPVAVSDRIITYEGVAITVDVMANDQSSIGINRNSIEIIAVPFTGIVEILPDKNIKYTPAVSFVGSVNITYRFKDYLNENSNVGVLNIEVLAGSPVAKANKDFYQTKNVGILNINTPYGLLVNDIGPGALTITEETKETDLGGSVDIKEDGRFTYLPPAGLTGIDKFQYTLNDGLGNTDSGEVEILLSLGDELWITLEEGELNRKIITEVCNGIEVFAGTNEIGTFILKFWANSTKTIPLNVNLRNLKINVRKKLTNLITGVVVADVTEVIPVERGTQYIINDFEIYQDVTECNGTKIKTQGELFLEIGPGYNI